MFQPVGVKTLLRLRSGLPDRPSSESAVSRRDSEGYEDTLVADRPPTAPPVLGSRQDHDRDTEPLLHTDIDGQSGNTLNQTHEEVEMSAGVLQEASSVLHQLQSGWQEERQGEIDQLWRECEAEYDLVLCRNAPGTPALGSLRATAGYGAAGLFGTCGGGGVSKDLNIGDGYVVSSDEPHAEFEAEVDAATQLAREDLEAAREQRRKVEARLAATSTAASSTSDALKQKVAWEAEVDNRRLASLRMEVDKLRAKADALSSSSTDRCQADAQEPPTPAAAAAMRSLNSMGPELGALDEWVEDLRVLNNHGLFSAEAFRECRAPYSRSKQSDMRAVASPLRPRNPDGSRSPQAVLSPTHLHGNKSPHSGISPKNSPTKREMARIAEQRALHWATQSPRSARSKPKSPLMPCGTDLPAALTHAPVSEDTATSAVEKQLDDILKELDEIDRIHDDVCMLTHS